jgi:type VI secretion system protein ImpA
MSENPSSLLQDPGALLLPISPNLPTGQWLRYEGTYDRVQEARREDDASLPQGVWKAPLKRADWPLVVSLCREALAHKSKDFQLAAWLLDAWVELHGFAGLTAGLRLLGGLTERYWADGFPELEEGEPSARLAPFMWLDEKVLPRLKRVPLTRPEGADVASHSFADWEAAAHREKLAARAGTKPTEGRRAESPGSEPVSHARILAAASLTPRSFLAARVRELVEARKAAAALEVLLDTNVGRQLAALHRLRRLLGEIEGVARQLLGSTASEPAPRSVPERESALESSSPEAGAEAPSAASSGPIQGRADAYRRLLEAADYLLRTEPHSPTPYLIKRAVAWGDMPLSKLLQELVETPDDLKSIYGLLGIRESK